jgi:hypothetical protein
MGLNIGGFKLDFSTVMQLGMAAMTGGASLALMAQQMATQAMLQMAIQKIGQELNLPPAIIQMAQMAATSQMSGMDSVDFSSVGGAQGFLDQAVQQFSATDQGNVNRALDAYSAAASQFAGRLEAQGSRLTAAYERATADVTAARANGASDRVVDQLEARADSAQQDMNKFDDFLNSINLSNSRKKRAGDMKGVMEGKGSLLMKIAILLGMIADQKMSDMADKAEQIGKMGEIKGKNQAKFTQMNSELQALGQELGTISQATANVIKSIGEAGSTLARKG